MILRTILFQKWKIFFGGVFDRNFVATKHSRHRYSQRINSSISITDAKDEVEYGTENGMVIGYVDYAHQKVIVRHLDAIYVCQNDVINPSKKVVKTTLNHFMSIHDIKKLKIK